MTSKLFVLYHLYSLLLKTQLGSSRTNNCKNIQVRTDEVPCFGPNNWGLSLLNHYVLKTVPIQLVGYWEAITINQPVLFGDGCM